MAICFLLAMLAAPGCRNTSPEAPRSLAPTAFLPSEPAEVVTPADPAEPQDEPRIRALSQYAVGIIQEVNNDDNGALAAYLESAKADPGNERLVLELSQRLVQAKRIQEALDLLKRSTARPQASGAVHAWYGLLLAQEGHTNQAIRESLIALERLPTLALPYLTLARAYQQSGKNKDAAKILIQAFHQPEATPEFLVEIADTAAPLSLHLDRQADLLRKEILDALDRALKMKPAAPVLLQRIADAFRAMAAYDRAAEIYQQLLERFAQVPGFRDVLREKLMDAYLKAGNKKAAQELLQLILAERPTNVQVYLTLGSLAIEAKDYPQAVDHFEKALLLNPDLELVYYELAGLRITLNQPQAALELLEKARARFSQSFNLELYTALAHSRMKHYTEALKFFTAAEIVANATDTNRLNHAYYFQLGATHERNRDFVQAEKHFRKCLELSPNNAEAMNYLGYMWAEQGVNLDEAKAFIEKALHLEPDNAAFLDSLGWVLFKQRRSRAALKYLEKAAQLVEEPDATIFDHLGDVYRALGYRDKAQAAWRKSLEIESNDTVQKKLNDLHPSGSGL